jgi:hypothetical protein
MKNINLLNSYRKNHMLFLEKSGYHLEPTHAQEPFQLNLFMDAIEKIDSKSPVMVELGVSKYPTYSIVFNDIFENKCLNICTEVLKTSLELASQRFPNGNFIHTYSGKPVHVQENQPNTDELIGIQNISLKEILTKYGVEAIDMLHVDIQGSEMSLLEEMESDGLLDKVDFLFLSLHPQAGDTFTFCKNILDRNIKDINYIFAHPSQGGFGDGLICARLKGKATT